MKDPPKHTCRRAHLGRRPQTACSPAPGHWRQAKSSPKEPLSSRMQAKIDSHCWWLRLIQVCRNSRTPALSETVFLSRLCQKGKSCPAL